MAITSNEKPERISYTLYVLPQTRRALRLWAAQHDATASSAVDMLTALYLEQLPIEATN